MNKPIFAIAAAGLLTLTTGGSAFAVSVTIEDTTEIERYWQGAAMPNTTDPGDDGWYDVIGGDLFSTQRIRVTWAGTNVNFEIETNLPEIGDGGVWSDDPILPADLAVDLDGDGVWETGVVLADHDWKDQVWATPDGSTTADHDEFFKVGYYGFDLASLLDPNDAAWKGPEDIVADFTTYGGRYDQPDPKPVPVWMDAESGLWSSVGSASVTWTAGTSTDYLVTVLLTGANADGAWNDFRFLWGTGTCGNDVITGRAVPEPGSMLLLGSGLLGMVGILRRRKV